MQTAGIKSLEADENFDIFSCSVITVSKGFVLLYEGNEELYFVTQHGTA